MFRDTWFSRFPALVDYHPAFDRIFENLLREFPRAAAASPYPPLNVREDPERLVVTVEVPGVDPESLDVKVQGDILTLSGMRRAATESSEGRVLRNERGHGSFTREINLPVKVNSEAVEARYDLGVLTVTLPKAAEAKPRLIKVKAG